MGEPIVIDAIRLGLIVALAFFAGLALGSRKP